MKPLRWKGVEYIIVLDASTYPRRYRFKKISDVTSNDTTLEAGRKVTYTETSSDPTTWELTIK